ncbi:MULTISPECIES: hypothetical protein [unclassified Arcicella]|uniref:hypothetical protein n=1 Tax=unclassified Arcicella TaxID=2644986 RepID=UPI00285B4F1F|nr:MULTISPECIES: hypothetical protein [unclassified Arcicella]MDR6563635.1 hypothetical protein [Arcicella sp. BE51]MDR6814227.1 hypothetical protein [Arcicella sp. BE140]MDR6825534.1 hypothetical protein [Arcicella sp. BE139]
MKIKTDPEIFQRTNNINPVNTKHNFVSDKLLLFEGFRRIYEVNVKINHILHEEINPIGTIYRLINEDINEKKNQIIDSNNRNNKDRNTKIGLFGYLVVQMYLTWEMFSENDFVKELYPMNPYHFFLRILERGVVMDRENRWYLVMSPYASYDIRKLLSKENYQETPYLVSTDDEYLDKINAYYAEHNELPPWLEEDNKRGYIL